MPDAHGLVTRVARHRALLCLVVVVLLAGCAGLFEDDPTLPEGEEAAERFESLDSYNATVTIEYTDSNGTTTWTGTQVVVPGDNQFYERLAGPDGTEITVSDGADTWVSVAGSDSVQKLNSGGLQDSINQDVRRLVEQAHTEEAAEDEHSVRLMPFVPQFRTEDRATVSEGRQQVTHEGTATVAGRQAHVIRIEGVNGDLWVQHYLDTEYFVPLKTTGRLDAGEHPFEYTLRYEDIGFEPELPPDLFEFTPPADATVQQYPFQEEGYNSLEELEAAANIRVPEPDVPSSYRLTDTERFVPGAETVELTFAGPEGELIVAKTNTSLSAATPDEQVDIGNGRTADLTLSSDHNSVTWTCEGSYYSVRGDLPRELLIDVASSIRC